MEKQKTSSSNWIVWLIALVFALPMILAVTYFTWVRQQEHSGLNHGQFLQPPLQVEDLSFSNKQGVVLAGNPWRGKWTLFYVSPQQCQQTCQQALHRLYQTWITLGRENHRITRVLLTTEVAHLNELSSWIEKNAPKTELAIIDPPSLLSLNQGQGGVLLMDPIGNIILQYSADLSTKGLHKDLKRLLKASRIG